MFIKYSLLLMLLLHNIHSPINPVSCGVDVRMTTCAVLGGGKPGEVPLVASLGFCQVTPPTDRTVATHRKTS